MVQFFRYKDTLKASLKAFNIVVTKWQSLASDRSAWRLAIHGGAESFEVSRTTKLDTKQAARKLR